MTNKKLTQIEQRIEKAKTKLVLIEEMRPGSLTRQYKHAEDQTGAYYQISYTLAFFEVGLTGAPLLGGARGALP